MPDLEQAKSAVLNTLTLKSGQRTYDHAITEFVEWYCSEPRLAFNRTVVLRYRTSLEQRQYAPSTINLRLAAVRRIAYEAADSGLLSPELADGIRRVKGVGRLGVRVGNWLTAEQGTQLLHATSSDTLRSKRNRAMLSLLIGCGLRRAELLGLTMNSIQLREDHWVIADLVGKGGHISYGSPSFLGEEDRGLLDEIGAHHYGSSVPGDQQGRQNLGRRDDAEGLWEVVKGQVRSPLGDYSGPIWCCAAWCSAVMQTRLSQVSGHSSWRQSARHH